MFMMIFTAIAFVVHFCLLCFGLDLFIGQIHLFEIAKAMPETSRQIYGWLALMGIPFGLGIVGSTVYFNLFKRTKRDWETRKAELSLRQQKREESRRQFKIEREQFHREMDARQAEFVEAARLAHISFQAENAEKLTFIRNVLEMLIESNKDNTNISLIHTAHKAAMESYERLLTFPEFEDEENFFASYVERMQSISTWSDKENKLLQ